ncbi:MAG: polysaccharide deacetylase family protein [Ignavibacteria bacterium]|nr:polysaccharide deacetylase family protein [Ignavibacteria bacterium]
MISLTSPPVLVKTIFRDIIWENTIDELVLTFDDGPHPRATKKVLDVLTKNNLKAIFFLIGENAVQNLDLVKSIVDQGSYIANHSHSHFKNLFLTGIENIREQIFECQNVIENFPNNLKLFRPPFGRLKGKMKKISADIGLKTMMWTKLTEDWYGEQARIRNNVMEIKQRNSIILFHDNEYTSEIIGPALQDSISILNDKGFSFARTFNF